MPEKNSLTYNLCDFLRKPNLTLVQIEAALRMAPKKYYCRPNCNFEDFCAMNNDQKNEVLLEAARMNANWRKLALDAFPEFEWILVIDGEVYDAGCETELIPDFDRLGELTRIAGKIAVVFCR